MGKHPRTAMLERLAAQRQDQAAAFARYGKDVTRLIQELEGPTQEIHDWAFDRLSQMGGTIVEPLLAALADPATSPFVQDELMALLAATGDERAIGPIWQVAQTCQDDEECFSSAMLYLATLGDQRALPYVREHLASDDPEIVANAVAALIMVGNVSDIAQLRLVHRRYPDHPEIRPGVVTCIFALLTQADRKTFERVMDDIFESPDDSALADDLWEQLERDFGDGTQHPRPKPKGKQQKR